MDETKTGNRGWSRRGFLQGSTAAMAAMYGLRPDYATAQIPNEYDGTKFQLAAPEPNPKREGCCASASSTAFRTTTSTSRAPWEASAPRAACMTT